MPVNLRNVPHFREGFAFSCLAACARMILAFYGLVHTEEEIRRHLRTGSHGTPGRSLFLLRSLGFEVRIEESNLKELDDSLTAGISPLVFLDTNHLEYWTRRCDHVAVLVGISANAVALNDPYYDTAPQNASLTGFESAWAMNENVAAFIRPRG